MPRKTFFYLLIIVAFLFLFETVYLNGGSKQFAEIASAVKDERETALEEKENKMIAAYQFDDYLDYHLEYSKVLFRDIYHFKKNITIYKGKNYNIKKNNLVITKDGLVGVVTKVDAYSSIVQLLTNENTSLSVKSNNSYGILKYKENELVVEGIDNKSSIEIGEKIYTSDLSLYPEHILVGVVKDIRYDKYEIEQILSIEPVVDFNNLSYLAVITDLRGAE